MDKVEPLRNLEPKREMLFWSLDEFNQFIASIDDIQYRLLFTFLYMSGCRKGEAAALFLNDFDFNKHTVSINKSITRKIAGKYWAIVTPKNHASNRVITLPVSFFNLLSEYKLWQVANSTATDFVFGDDEPFADNTIARRLKRYCDISGVKVIRIHDFRHSHASYLISNGVSIVAVAKRLGHSSIEQTLATYTHLMPSDNDLVDKALENICT